MKDNTLLFSYYNFLEKYKRDPYDIEDLFDGIQAIVTTNKIKEYVNK